MKGEAVLKSASRCDVFSAFVIKVGHLCFVTSQVLTLSLKQWGWYLSIVQSTRVAGFLFDSSGLSWTDTCHQYPGPSRSYWKDWRDYIEAASLFVPPFSSSYTEKYITTFLKLTCTILMSVKRQPDIQTRACQLANKRRDKNATATMRKCWNAKRQFWNCSSTKFHWNSPN